MDQKTKTEKAAGKPVAQPKSAKSSKLIMTADQTVIRPSSLPDETAAQRPNGTTSVSSKTVVSHQGSWQSATDAQNRMINMTSASRSFQDGGYSFELGEMKDQSTAFQVANAPFPPMPPGQTASFRTGTIKDQARLVSGSINSDDLHELFKREPSTG